MRSRLCLQFACFVYTFHIQYQLMYTNIKEDKHSSQNKKRDLTWIPGGKQKVCRYGKEQIELGWNSWTEAKQMAKNSELEKVHCSLKHYKAQKKIDTKLNVRKSECAHCRYVSIHSCVLQICREDCVGVDGAL